MFLDLIWDILEIWVGVVGKVVLAAELSAERSLLGCPKGKVDVLGRCEQLLHFIIYGIFKISKPKQIFPNSTNLPFRNLGSIAKTRNIKSICNR